MERQLLRKGNSRVSPHQTTKKLQTGVIYHPVHGYPIAPPVPVAVARRNARERNRVKTVNDSYQHLKNHVPGAARQKRMSKVDIIKHSIDYIQKLQKMVEDSQKTSFPFPSYQHQQMNNMQSDNGQAFPPQFQNEYHYTSSNQNTSRDMFPEVPVSPSSSSTSSSGSTCSSSDSSNLLSSYLSSLCSSYPRDSYNTNSNLVDDQLLEDNILDVIAEWQDS